MNCREMIDFLMDYLDDELSVGEKKQFDQHLDICPECVDYLQSYRDTVHLEKICHPSDEAPPEMPEELVTAILSARKQQV